MAYSLRLPSHLDIAARARSEYLGISINALMAVALDAYLRASESPKVDFSPLPLPDVVKAPPGEFCKAPEPSLLVARGETRKQRRQREHIERLQAKGRT